MTAHIADFCSRIAAGRFDYRGKRQFSLTVRVTSAVDHRHLDMNLHVLLLSTILRPGYSHHRRHCLLPCHSASDVDLRAYRYHYLRPYMTSTKVFLTYLLVT